MLQGFKDASCVFEGFFILTVKFLWSLPECVVPVYIPSRMAYSSTDPKQALRHQLLSP